MHTPSQILAEYIYILLHLLHPFLEIQPPLSISIFKNPYPIRLKSLVASSSQLHCIPNGAATTFTEESISIPRSFSLKQNIARHICRNNILQLDSRNEPNRTESKLARVWREIHGLNNWENLVDPLNPLLRREILRYGEFVAACYKAFDLDPNSKRYLNCKYRKRSMLRQVGLGDSGYDVTKYIYATPLDTSIPIRPDPGARWIGYVAASWDRESAALGRRDIVITFRGTVTNPEWMANFMSSLTPARFDPHEPRPDVKVETGFLSLYTSDDSCRKFGLRSCREQLLSELSRLLNKHKKEKISITIAGHSMGSSLALLLGYDLAELGLNRPNQSGKEIPVTVFSFGGPRVGNSGFKERCEELGVKVLRVVNVNDPITKMPGVLFNENFKGFRGRYEFPWSCSCYAHVGVELMLDFFKMHNPTCVRDLENYLRLLKCPKGSKRDRKGTDLGERTKGFLSDRKRSIDVAFQWRNVAINMLNLVQSQWT